MGWWAGGGGSVYNKARQRESARVSPPMQADRSRLYDVVLLRVGTMVPPSSAMELLCSSLAQRFLQLRQPPRPFRGQKREWRTSRGASQEVYFSRGSVGVLVAFLADGKLAGEEFGKAGGV